MFNKPYMEIFVWGTCKIHNNVKMGKHIADAFLNWVGSSFFFKNNPRTLKVTKASYSKSSLSRVQFFLSVQKMCYNITLFFIPLLVMFHHTSKKYF